MFWTYCAHSNILFLAAGFLFFAAASGFLAAGFLAAGFLAAGLAAGALAAGFLELDSESSPDKEIISTEIQHQESSLLLSVSKNFIYFIQTIFETCHNVLPALLTNQLT